jgi:hypothetical protein
VHNNANRDRSPHGAHVISGPDLSVFGPAVWLLLPVDVAAAAPLAAAFGVVSLGVISGDQDTRKIHSR